MDVKYNITNELLQQLNYIYFIINILKGIKLLKHPVILNTWRGGSGHSFGPPAHPIRCVSTSHWPVHIYKAKLTR